MTMPAVPAPSSAPGETQASTPSQATPENPASAPAAPPPSSAPAENASQQPQNEVQTPPEPRPAARTRRTATPPGSQAPSAPAKTDQQVIQDYLAQQREEERRVNIQKSQDDLRTFRQQAPLRARDLFDQFAEAVGFHIPHEDRKPFLDLVEEMNLKAYEAAKLELGDEGTAASSRATQILAQTSNGFYESFESEEDMDAFAEAVEGKPPAAWPKEHARMHQEIGEANAIGTFAEMGAGLLGEASRGAFAEAASKAETVEDVVKAFYDAATAEGNARPVGQSRLAVANAASGPGRYRSDAELNAAKSRGEITDAEYLTEQNRLWGVT